LVAGSSDPLPCSCFLFPRGQVEIGPPLFLFPPFRGVVEETQPLPLPGSESRTGLARRERTSHPGVGLSSSLRALEERKIVPKCTALPTSSNSKTFSILLRGGDRDSASDTLILTIDARASFPFFFSPFLALMVPFPFSAAVKAISTPALRLGDPKDRPPAPSTDPAS